ncbi:hypothetical protein KC902_01615 [Candidatus Kaiserbacteria bacterium]|nr:hypothetical protein [Candidatus Kaiserbacteria bacterium]
MKTYILVMYAYWVFGAEHPSGKRDVHETKQREVRKNFTAEDADAARLMAITFVKEFWEELPKKRKGSLSWQENDPHVRVELAEVVSFDWKRAFTSSEAESAA